MSGLCAQQRVPQLGVFLVLGFSLVSAFWALFRAASAQPSGGLPHLLQVDQQLDLLKLIPLKFNTLLFAAHQRGGTALHGIGQGGLLGSKLGFACVQLGLGGIQLRCASVSFCSACANWRSASAFCSL